MSATAAAVRVPTLTQRLRTSETAGVFGAALIGGIAWSGASGALVLALVAPWVILSGGSRGAVAARALAYFAAATWPIVPSAAVFFGEGGSMLRLLTASMGGWILIAAANSVPWVLFSPQRGAGRVASLLLGLLLPAIPPLALIGLASPLAGVGLLLPATGLAGCVAYVLAGVMWVGSPRVHVRASAALGLMGIAAIAQTATAPHGASDPQWQAVSTAVGGPLAETRSPPDATAIEQLRITMGRSSSENVVLPESYFRAWSAAMDAFLEPLWRRLAQEKRTVTFGAQRLTGETGQIDSLVLVRGAFRGELSQHYPVPLSMYRFGAPGSVPMRWRGSYVLPVGTERPAVMICWEQLLLAPMLGVMLESPRPTRLIAVSNLYFARGTPVARIQRASVAAWARLLGVPFVYASNE